MFASKNGILFFSWLYNKHKSYIITTIISLGFWSFSFGQNNTKPIPCSKTFEWNVITTNLPNGENEKLISFSGATYNPDSYSIPIYHLSTPLPLGTNEIKVTITNTIYKDISTEEALLLKHKDKIKEAIDINAVVSQNRRTPVAVVQMTPLVLDPNSKKLKKIAKISFQLSPIVNYSLQQARGYSKPKGNSVLSSGDWYRIAVSNDGVHKISYNLMKELGIDVDAINPQQINIYGNGIGLLPEENDVYRHDDLKINSISIMGEEDGSFDAGDYILFFAKGPHEWKFDSTSSKFVHAKHLYSDLSNYFIGIGVSPAKRISNIPQSSQTPNYSTNSFDDHQFHELDKTNLISSGREWYGEEFNIIDSHEFSFNFPNILKDSLACLKTHMLGRTVGTDNYSEVEIFVSGTPRRKAYKIQGVPEGYLTDKGRPGIDLFKFIPTGDNVVVNVRYNKYNPSAEAWLNFLEINARRHLTMAGNQMIFRDKFSVGPNKISRFQISNPNRLNEVWDITDPTDAKRMVLKSDGNVAEFIIRTDVLRAFIAFNNANFFEPKVMGKVPNQNLHSLSNIDLMIVTHPLFLSQANELAQFHKEEGLTTHVATNQEVYNEFSSGTADITAIKDLMKMLYNKAGTDTLAMPKYLLLFGDGSYNNRIPASEENSNYVLTYQSPISYSLIKSFVSDDYYGLLDPHESNNSFDIVDIGIGRLPVRTVAEAQVMLKKIKHYARPGSATSLEDPLFKDWRNVISLIADDGDKNRHINDAEDLSKIIGETNPQINLKKIYLDSYQQESTALGEKYPDVNREITDLVKKGALIINYTGHGGELGWAHEQILDNPTILGWDNLDNLPLFFTATCEFSRYDDPNRTSAGEYVLLNPKGGGIALLTTTRLVFATPNADLNRNFYSIALDPIKNKTLRLGDLNRITKASSVSTGLNRRNFSLLGDPALKLNFPNKKVVTSTLNGKPIGGGTDTIKALSTVTITGFVADNSGAKLVNFNGIVYPTVYDKASKLKTLGQNDDSYETPFYALNNKIYKGKATVTNGDFSFTFTVPRDINYKFGDGRISYYAFNGITDASGYNQNLTVGGSSDSLISDVTGPKIELFLNDESFINGSSTDEKPILLAKVWDQNGINTIGSGIGHDIITTIDDKTEKAIVLNDFYEADLDTYQGGKVNYSFSNIEEGPHNLKLKIWDVYNNSSEAELDFVVAKSEEMAINRILNYPNPFVNRTDFYFEHNQPFKRLNVRVQIFTVSGKLVKTINTFVETAGFKNTPITWNGTDDYGDRLGRGVYLYKIKVSTEEGKSDEEIEKLVILN